MKECKRREEAESTGGSGLETIEMRMVATEVDIESPTRGKNRGAVAALGPVYSGGTF
jgi:hypothetical protein